MSHADQLAEIIRTMADSLHYFDVARRTGDPVARELREQAERELMAQVRIIAPTCAECEWIARKAAMAAGYADSVVQKSVARWRFDALAN